MWFSLQETLERPRGTPYKTEEDAKRLVASLKAGLGGCCGRCGASGAVEAAHIRPKGKWGLSRVVRSRCAFRGLDAWRQQVWRTCRLAYFLCASCHKWYDGGGSGGVWEGAGLVAVRCFLDGSPGVVVPVGGVELGGGSGGVGEVILVTNLWSSAAEM